VAPFVKPLITLGLAVVPINASPSVAARAVAAPVPPFIVYETVIVPFPGVTEFNVTLVGACPGVIDGDDADATDSVPVFDIAVTVKVTGVAILKPLTTIGELLPVADCPVLAFTLYVIVPLPAYDGAVKYTEALVPVVLLYVGVPDIVGVPGCLPPESLNSAIMRSSLPGLPMCR
jgi:hypothetical protein